MKFVLILYLCSFATEPQCFQEKIVSLEFTNYHQCITQGYMHSYNHLKMFDVDEVNKKRLAIRFNCKEVGTPT